MSKGAKRERPKVLLAVDRAGWAFENIARQVSDRLGDRFEFETIHTQGDNKQRPQHSEYDAAVCFWWGDARWVRKMGVRADRVYVGVYDHFSWRDNAAFLVETVPHAAGVFCANEALLEEVRTALPAGVRDCQRFWLCEDGVDVDRFPMLPLPQGLVCGWAGNSKTSAGIKGLDLIRAACEAERVPLVVADCTIETMAKRIPHERMSAEHYALVSCEVCASVKEGTPNPVLEALSSGRPVLTTRVGVATKAVRHGVNGFVVERTVGELRAGLRALKEDKTRLALASHARPSVVASWTWASKVLAFEDMLLSRERPLVAVVGAFAPDPEKPQHVDEFQAQQIASQLDKGALARVVRVGLPGHWHRADVLDVPPPGAQIVNAGLGVIPALVPRDVELKPWTIGGSGEQDLTSALTVFVTTVGADDFAYCMDALARQDCRFRLRVIANVAPMSAAFQRMIDECQTPFYVQVDEDMILRPDAVRRLHEAINGTPEDVAIWFYGLHDVFTGLCLTGVKAYRHEIVKRFPYRPEDHSCEVGQNERLKAAGYRVAGRYPGLRGDPQGESCVGDLNAHWTPWGAFEKYERDMEKFRRQPGHQGWMKILPQIMVDRLARDPGDEVALAALAGCIVGLTTEIKEDGEKDFRAPAHRKTFDTLMGLMHARRAE